MSWKGYDVVKWDVAASPVHEDALVMYSDRQRGRSEACSGEINTAQTIKHKCLNVTARVYVKLVLEEWN
jgi:hypothetical protein